MIVTIDGPAGAGKSTAARALARRLGFDYLDTGAMFRAVTLAAVRAEVDIASDAALERLLGSLAIDMPPGKVILNGEDVTGLIRSPEVTALASKLAVRPVVRQHLARLQRQLGEQRSLVCEGRDQGTVVFPDALAKFFLVADPVERARRRQRDLAEQGKQVPLEEVLHAQEERDRRDASRDLAPMVPAADAVILDSTQLSLDQVVSQMEQHVRARLEGTGCTQPTPS